jgi:uncharacterized protein DUF669
MGLTLNISEQEAESKAFDDLPAGKYNCKITDVSVEEVKKGDNAGKEYYHFEFTIQDGKYENQKMWANAMLWAGAAYTIVNILKALGQDVGTQLEVPDAEWFITRDIVVKMSMGKAQIGDGTKENPQYPARVEARSFFPYGSGTTAASAGKKDSLLP